jgi:hypothetical protein
MNKNSMLEMFCKMYHQLEQVQEDCNEVIELNRLYKRFLCSEGLEEDFRRFTIENEFKEEEW